MSQSPPSPEPGLNWRRLAVPIYGPTVLVSIGVGAITPLIPLVALERGSGTAFAAFVVGLLGIGQLIGDLPAGALAERFGEKRALFAACLVDAVLMLVIATTDSLAALSIAALLSGMEAAVFGLARHAYLSEAVPARYRARALSTLGGTFRIGTFIGPFVAAGIVAVSSMNLVFGFAAVMSVAGGVLSLTLPDLPGHEAVRKARASGELAADDPARRSTLAVLGEHRRVLLTLGTGVVMIMIARAARQSIIPLWAESQGLDATQTSLLFGIASGVDMLLFYPGGMIMDRFGRMWVTLPAMVVMGVGFALLPFTHTALTIGAVACLMGLGNGISAGIVLTLGADVAPVVNRRQFLAAWRLCADAGVVAGPGLISLITLGWPLAVAAFTLAGIAWLGSGWLARWVPRRTPDAP